MHHAGARCQSLTAALRGIGLNLTGFSQLWAQTGQAVKHGSDAAGKTARSISLSTGMDVLSSVEAEGTPLGGTHQVQPSPLQDWACKKRGELG